MRALLLTSPHLLHQLYILAIRIQPRVHIDSAYRHFRSGLSSINDLINRFWVLLKSRGRKVRKLYLLLITILFAVWYRLVLEVELKFSQIGGPVWLLSSMLRFETIGGRLNI